MSRANTESEQTGVAESQSLPVPPRIIAQVVEVAAAPDSVAADLAGLIDKDPTLTTQLLRASNSAYYGLRQQIESVHHAVAFMGMSAVRNLVLCIGVQQIAPAGKIRDFPLDVFWECSLRRAAASACLAKRLGLGRPDESFTLGLCQDVGILARLGADSSFTERYAQLLNEPAESRLAAERELGETHDTLGAELLKRWKLPAELTESVRLHHDPDRAPLPIRERCLVARTAETVADLLQVTDKSAAIAHAKEGLTQLPLSPDLLSEIVDEVAADVAAAAAMLRFNVGSQPSYGEIAATAGDALFALSLSGSDAPGGLRRAIHDQQRLTAELQQQNEELQRQAATDPLTGLANRRQLDDVLRRDLSQAARQGHSASILLLDIDHFKRINDTYGHKAGDEVLRGVASVIRRAIRGSDVCARFGGEEFAVVLPFSDEPGARVAAERIWREIGGHNVDWEGSPLSVTVSVGGVTVDGVALRGTAFPDPAEEVLRLADQALYEAKAAGRNRICWHAADPESPA